MKFEYISSSIVVTAKDHNPTILHPSFLETRNIVPKNWTYKFDVITSPAVSSVKYTNNYSFSVDNFKLQIFYNKGSQNISKSLVHTLAKKYIEKLCEVKYTAVGINFSAFLEIKDAENFLINKFLDIKKLKALKYDLDKVDYKFSYKLKNTVLNIMLNSGTLIRAQDHSKADGIFIDANYHNNIQGDKIIEEAKKYLDTYKDKCKDFQENLIKIFNGKVKE